jgi:hypothetical protein
MRTYQEHRGNIQSGDLIAFSNMKWKSWHDLKIQFVKFVLQTEYSHVAIAWVVGDRVFAMEAVEPCARIYPLSKLGDFYHIPLNGEWTPEVEEKALAFVGSEYKQLRAIRAFFTPLEKDEASQCAALAIAIASKMGIDLGNRATPDEVVLQAQQQGSPTYYVRNESK